MDIRKISGYTNTKGIIKEAVFSDTTANFVSNPLPAKGEIIKIWLRTAKNDAKAAFLHINNSIKPMKKEQGGELFDYYAVSHKISAPVTYYFRLTPAAEGNDLFYTAEGAGDTANADYFFRIIPGYSVPEWAFDAVMYQIYPDRFFCGDKTNNVVNNEYAYLSKAAKHIDNWRAPVAESDYCNFYGGDLAGVMQKLGYLKDLGVTCIYFTPIFVSPSNHKYDCQDYDYIDPHLGRIPEDGGEALSFEKFHNRFATKYIARTTKKENLEASNALFAELTRAAHDIGIRVIIDGVFNHCGAFNKWLDKESFYYKQGYPAGAYRDKNSKYHKYFSWYDDNWPNNDCYDSWWGHDNHPKLNFEGSRELYNYILDIGRKWVKSPYNCDGWRLDVAADLGRSREFNHKFWRDFNAAVKDSNPEALITAEHYSYNGDTREWLTGDQWDTIMNYDAFMEPITWFLTGMEKHSEEYREDMRNNAMAFEGAMRYHMSRFTYPSLHSAMNELSNHDHSRFLTRTNMKAGRHHTHGSKAADTGINKAVMHEAVIFQMTWPGSPTIYYGDEAGVTGWTDPDCRRTYPWGKEDQNMINLHKELIKIRKAHPALRTGSVCFLYSHYGILSYARWDKDNTLIVILNNNDTEKKLTVPVWKSGYAQGFLKKLISASDGAFNTDEVKYELDEGLLYITLPKFGAVVLVGV